MQTVIEFPEPGEIKKSPAVIHSKAELTFMEKKISNALFQNAYATLDSKTVHTIRLAKLKEKCEYDSNDAAYFKKSIEALQSKSIKYDIFDEFGKETGWGVGSIISWVHVHNGTCQYEYPQKLASLMSDPDRFVRINLKVQNLLTSGHTYTIYELCSITKGLLAKRNIVYSKWYPLPVLHQILGTTDKKTYKVFGNLKRYILDKAVVEIALKTDIKIDYETQKEGRQVKSVRFLIQKNDNQPTPVVVDDEMNTATSVKHSAKEYTKIIDVFGVTEKAATKIFSSHELPYIKEKIKITDDAIQNGSVSRPAGFFVKALNEDYQVVAPSIDTNEPTPPTEQDRRDEKAERLKSQIETQMFTHESYFASEAKASYLSTLSEPEKDSLLAEIKIRVPGTRSLNQNSIGFIILEKIQGYDDAKTTYLAERREVLEKRMQQALARKD